MRRIYRTPAILLACTLPVLALASDTAAEPTPPPPTDKEIKQFLINQSIWEYRGRCACPYNKDSSGRKCGERSAYKRPGGAEPLCYAKDVTDSMVADYRDGKPVRTGSRRDVFRLVVGGGMSIGFGDHLDFREHAGPDGERYLLLESGSQVRTSGMAGVAVKLWRSVDFFTSLNATDSSASIKDGLVFGIDFRIKGHFGLAVGYQARRKSGVSQVFFERVRKQRPDIRSKRDLDGLLLGSYYPTSPIIDRYNHGLFLGVIFPVKFSAMFD